jgi:Mrp family chromosome partitioning ATPase
MPAHAKESFRALRTNLLLREHPLRTILVVSAVPGEGKSTIVRNLAIAYREEGQRVAVIDGDLRNPSLSGLFGVHNGPGLIDVLTGGATLDEAMEEVPVHAEGLETVAKLRQAMSRRRELSADAAGRQGRRSGVATATASDAPSGNGVPTANGNGTGKPDGPGWLSVLSTGPRPANPVSVIGSSRFHSLLDEIAAHHDVVLIDSSPMLSVSDVVPLLHLVDGVIVASRLSLTTRGAAAKLKESIARVPGAEVVGVAVNAGEEPQGGYYPYYGPRRRLTRASG